MTRQCIHNMEMIGSPKKRKKKSNSSMSTRVIDPNCIAEKTLLRGTLIWHVTVISPFLQSSSRHGVWWLMVE
jgi:hypothetical protein